MVLGVRLTAFLVSSLCLFSVPACGEEAVSVLIGGKHLKIVERDGRCLVEYGDAVRATGLPAPCRFLRRGRSGDAAVSEYVDRGSVVLIAGALAHPSDYGLVEDRSAEDRCSHMGRGVVVRDGSLHLSEVFVEPLGFCADAAPDEKFYYGIAFGEHE